jgi:hypothetical protein
MGDVEIMIRRKEFVRDPALTDDENFELHRAYFGSPFKAPGTIGAKTVSGRKDSLSL